MDVSGEAIRECLAKGAPIRLRARGTSMRPLLPSGTHILVAPVTPSTKLHVGDVVLTSVGRGLVLHRIVRLSVRDGGLVIVTRGDARRAADAPVPHERILGRVDEMTRAGRAFNLRRPWWRGIGYLAARGLPYLWFLRQNRAGPA